MLNASCFRKMDGAIAMISFDVRIGISDGRAIIFKDINRNYNVAGNPVNLASRVMGFGDRQQVLLTEEAYKNMIDMTEDTDLESKFKTHGKMQVKHNVTVGIYQYVGAGDNFINTKAPIQVELQTQLDAIRQNPILKI
jgi:class 3 adenylate cyclase